MTTYSHDDVRRTLDSASASERHRGHHPMTDAEMPRCTCQPCEADHVYLRHVATHYDTGDTVEDWGCTRCGAVWIVTRTAWDAQRQAYDDYRECMLAHAADFGAPENDA